MAKRIYDQSLGQLAGVQVTTDGLGNITRDGTEAYAQMVVSASGQTISSTAGTGNLVSLSGATVAAGSISFSANNQYAIIDTQGFEGAAFTITGFGTATLAVQWSNLAASGFTSGTVSTVGSSTTGTTITANGQYTAASGGRYMKILVTAFTTGPIVVTPVLIAGSSVGGSGGGAGGTADATATAAAPTYVEGTDNALSQNLSGNLRVYDAVAAASLATIAAATATINVAPDTSVIFNGSTSLTPKFAVIGASTSGDNNVLVAAVASKKIRVLAYLLSGSAAVNAKFSSDPAGTPSYITGLHYIVSGGQGAAPAFCPVGLFETASGKALGINLSGAVAVGGWLVYIEV